MILIQTPQQPQLGSFSTCILCVPCATVGDVYTAAAASRLCSRFLRVKAVTINAIDQVDGIIKGTTTVVIRSIWDDDQGHMLSGVLYEARYQLENVKSRTTTRSEVLEKLINAFQAEGIPMASMPIRQV